MFEAVAAIIAASIAALAGIGTAIGAGFQSSKENEIERDRQDSTYQRAVDDALKAGFNPLVATNNSYSPTTVSKPSESILSLANMFSGMSGSLLDNSFKVKENQKDRDFSGSESEKDRQLAILKQDKDLKSAYDNLCLQLRSNENIASVNNQTQSAIAKLQSETARAGQKMLGEQFQQELVFKKQVRSGDIIKWQKEYEQNKYKIKLSRDQYIADKVLTYLLPDANTVVSSAANFFGGKK